MSSVVVVSAVVFAVFSAVATCRPFCESVGRGCIVGGAGCRAFARRRIVVFVLVVAPSFGRDGA